MTLAAPIVLLPRWRWRALLMALLLAGFGVLLGRAVYLQGLHNDFLQQKGRCALRPRDRAPGAPRHDHRPQRRAAGDQHAGRIGVGQPAGRRDQRRATEADSRNCCELDPARDRQEAGRDRARVRLSETRICRRKMPHRSIAARACRAFSCSANTAATTRAATSSRICSALPMSTMQGRKASNWRSTTGSRARPGSRRVIKDRLGHIVEDVGGDQLAAGRPAISRCRIDRKLQYLAYRELEACRRAAQGQGRRHRGARRQDRRDSGAWPTCLLQPE